MLKFLLFNVICNLFSYMFIFGCGNISGTSIHTIYHKTIRQLITTNPNLNQNFELYKQIIELPSET